LLQGERHLIFETFPFHVLYLIQPSRQKSQFETSYHMLLLVAYTSSFS
jgi:hypothetical protein